MMGVTVHRPGVLCRFRGDAGSPGATRGASGIQHSITDRQSTITNDSIIDDQKSKIDVHVGLARTPRRCFDACRRGGPDHGARALADAGALRRLEHLLRLRADAVPPAARTPGPTIAACAEAGRHWVEGGVLVAEIVLLAFFSIPFWTQECRRGATARKRGHGRPRRRRAVRVERALPRRRRRVRSHRHSSSSAPDNPFGTRSRRRSRQGRPRRRTVG